MFTCRLLPHGLYTPRSIEVTGFVRLYFKVTFGKLLFTKALLLVLLLTLWTFAQCYLITFNPQRLQYEHALIGHTFAYSHKLIQNSLKRKTIWIPQEKQRGLTCECCRGLSFPCSGEVNHCARGLDLLRIILLFLATAMELFTFNSSFNIP